MDPLSALGLAANIIQFLDFGGKLVSGAIELYKSVDGATSLNSRLEYITRDLGQLCGKLGAEADECIQLNAASEAALVPLVKSCEDLGREFLASLERLKVKSSRKSWTSIRQALRCVWNARDIQNYEKQLENFRSEIATRLLVILKEQQEHVIAAQLTASEKVRGVADTLDQLTESLKRLEMSSQCQVFELRRSIAGSLQEILGHHKKGLCGTELESIAFSELPACLLKLTSESVLLRRQIKVIESLQFPGMVEREQRIKIAHPGTLEWLFEEESTSNLHSNIFRWLRKGDGIYWISGKAGSGKSTLMKFFHNHDRTHAALRQWAGDRRLLVASFFFWNAGTTMQKSQIGLLQTLLYHIFRRAPELIANTCPSRWQRELHYSHTAPWKYEEILQAFGRLGVQQMDSVRFCFFIDGLDEYDGDHLDLIKILNDFIPHGAIKVCFSSRPWNVFERVYGENQGLRLRLQDQTRDDIRRFTEERLAEGTNSLSLVQHGAAYESLVNEIVNRSDGVFLWVYLVVRSLRRGMTNLDTPVELQQRLRELPTELETYFKQILDSTEKVYHQQAARLYQICLVSKCQITALDLAWFAERDPDFGIRDDLLAISQTQLYVLSQETVIRVTARCQDLVEFVGANLQFLHRTVKDFLETKDMSAWLEARSGRTFNAYNFLCNSFLLQMRLKCRLSNPSALQIAAFDRLASSLCRHAHGLNLHLLKEWVRCVWGFLLRVNDKAQTGQGSERGSDKNTIAEEKLEKYLLQYIDDIISIDASIECVLFWTLDDALSSPTNSKTSLVRLLLDLGMDPNQRTHGETSGWTDYLNNLKSQVSISHTDEEVIKLMLLHGADPNALTLEVLQKLPEEYASELMELHQSCLCKQTESQQPVVNNQSNTLPIRKRSFDEGLESQPEEDGHASKRGRHSKKIVAA